MLKFNRKYELSIQDNSGNYITVAPPLTLSFDVSRTNMAQAGPGTFRIYNLSPDHRYKLQKNVNDLGNLRFIYFKAGYGEELSLIFVGNIQQAYSVREGTNFVTYIEAFDAGFAFVNARSSISIPAGTTRAAQIEELVKDLPGVTVGAIGNSFTDLTTRANAFKGPTVDILYELTGGQFFIDLAKAYALADHEYLEPRGVMVISPETGLLSTPEREQTNMRYDMIFEPKLRLGQVVTLEGVGEKYLNGVYKVISLHHHGMISDSQCGDLVSTVGLFAPYAGFKFTLVSEVN